MKIELNEGAKPEDIGYSSLYDVVGRATENLAKRFIESSATPWAAPILFTEGKQH